MWGSVGLREDLQALAEYMDRTGAVCLMSPIPVSPLWKDICRERGWSDELPEGYVYLEPMRVSDSDSGPVSWPKSELQVAVEARFGN